MKKYTIVLACLLSLSGTAMAKIGEGKPGYPEFEGDYIKVHSNLVTCGGFTILPKEDLRVRIIAYKYTKGLFGDVFERQEVLSKNPDKEAKGIDKNYVEVEGGFRTKYNWPGVKKQYRVFCQLMDKHGTWMKVPCRNVVTIENIRHRRACPKVLQWFGKGAGSQAYYKPLNMR